MPLHSAKYTVIGRSREDYEKRGTDITGFIGKHIVGTGEEAHLTTPVMIDLLKPHMILITGKRGTGKSYFAGVIAEEILNLPEEKKGSLAVVFIDTMGIFWSMKRPNEQQIMELKEWGIEPKAFDDILFYVPESQIGDFQKAGMPVDGGINIAPSEFTAEEWRLAFGLNPTDPAGITLEKNVNQLITTSGDESYNIEDLISQIRDDQDSSKEVRDALISMLTVASQWGVFGTEGTKIEDIVKPGKATIVDVSHLRGTEAWSIRNLIVALIARTIYRKRVIARKGEELKKIGENIIENVELKKLEEAMTQTSRMEKPKEKQDTEKFPMTWLIIDEAHNFIPNDTETVSTAPLNIIAKQGREPGVSLIVMTQMPNKVHQELLSQCDLVFSHRLTSRDDLQALHSVMQTYMEKDLWQYINSLPRWPGTTIALDDNLEKVFAFKVRPRMSWHAGGTAELF